MTMPKLFPYLFPLLLLICAFSMGYGVNLKKWYGWAQVLAGFLLGWLMGWPSQNVTERIILGTFIAVMTILFGPIAWKRRQR
jgi:hypothetical protein